MSEWSNLGGLLPPVTDLNYHEFWSRRDAATKQKIIIYRQFGRRYFVKLESKSGLFKKEAQTLGEFPTVGLALQFVVDYAAVHLPVDWGGREISLSIRSTALNIVGIPFSEVTPPDGMPGEVYVRLETEMWRKFLKRAAKESKIPLEYAGQFLLCSARRPQEGGGSIIEHSR
jgi:hypothetical protein